MSLFRGEALCFDNNVIFLQWRSPCRTTLFISIDNDVKWKPGDVVGIACVVAAVAGTGKLL
jgi:hypothetical protein